MITGFLTDLLYILIVLLTFPFWILRFRSEEFREIIGQRLKPALQTDTSGKVVWLHAVSVGEVKSLLSFIEEFNKSGNFTLILSVTTVSGYKYAKEQIQSIPVIPSPLDFSGTMRKFFKAIKPDIIVLNELEIWPNWLLTAKLFKVPVILINGRISAPAFRKYMKIRALMKPVFNRISSYMLQAEIYTERFKALGIPEANLEVLGNIKADEAVAALNNLEDQVSIIKHLKAPSKPENLTVFASTHKEDTDLIIPALQICGQVPSVIVPRHPSSALTIESRLRDAGLNATLWSKSEKVDLNSEILIYDSIGYLFNIMKIADAVYMGGTCSAETGGHNLYEPAVLNLPLAGGIHCENFPVILEKLKKADAYLTVTRAEELADFIQSAGKISSRGSRKVVDNLTGTNKTIIDKLTCILK